MTHVVQREFIRCPYGMAKTFLEGELMPSEDGRLEWTLHLAPPDAGLLDLAKEVDVTVARSTDPMHFDQPWLVTWVPHGGGPYPTFTGLLTVRADEDWNVAVLELVGEYEPPLGVAGKAFDMMLGTRIAASTAKALLAQIGAHLVARYREVEAHKQVLP